MGRSDGESEAELELQVVKLALEMRELCATLKENLAHLILTKLRSAEQRVQRRNHARG
jgi:hypothetical protein